MATNKTIDPTNVTVQIPAMADKPNQATNSNCLDKIIDGVNALNSKLNSVPTFNTLTVPANGSATIALPTSGTRFMIGFNGSGIGARMGLWVMYSNATNSAIQEIKQSSVLSATAGADGITFTNSTAAAQLVKYIIIEGT